MAPDSKNYKRNPNFIFRKIVDEVVLVPIYQDLADMDSIFTLNEVGAFLWEKLENQISQLELQALVLTEYDSEPEILKEDMDRFLSEMVAIGAVQEL